MAPFIALMMFVYAGVCGFIAYRRFTGQDDVPAGSWQERLAAMGQRVGASGGEEQRRALQARLTAAGLRTPEWPDLFVAAQLFAVVALIALAVIAGALLHGDPTNVVMLVLACGVAGYLLPLFMLDSRADARRAQISRSLPGAVDLLTSTIEAGLGVEQALERVAAAMTENDPILAEELSVTVREISAGIALDEAMRRLGRRVNLDELSALCAVIAQASILGARIGQSLRDYATAARRTRIASLEERAGKLSARLTLPIVFCLLPSCLIVMLAPAIVQAIRVFGGAE